MTESFQPWTTIWVSHVAPHEEEKSSPPLYELLINHLILSGPGTGF